MYASSPVPPALQGAAGEANNSAAPNSNPAVAPMDVVAKIQQHDAALQKVSGAMLVAMGEVDTLRTHMQQENSAMRDHIQTVHNEVMASKAGLEREMRETIDTVIANLEKNATNHFANGGGMNNSNINHSHYNNNTNTNNAAALSAENHQLRARLESLETAVRSLQAQHAPLTIDKVLSQTRTFLEQTDKEVESIRLNMEEKMRWVDGKMADVVAGAHQKDIRLQEQLDAFTAQQSRAFEEMTAAMRRRETSFIAQQQQQNQTLLSLTAGGAGGFGGGPTEVMLPPEVELRMSQLAKQSAAVDKRVMMAEESIAQLDAEQRDLVTSLQSLRAAMQAEKIRNSQTRTAGGGGVGGGGLITGDGPMGEALTVVTVRDEVIRSIENEQINRNRLIKEEIIAIRGDVQKALGQVDRNAGDVTRIANQYQGVQQSLTRVESNVGALQERLEGEMRAQFARAEVTQKAFFARQDQLLANERHQIATKLSSDIQTMQQKSLQEHQAAEIRRTDDIRASHTQLRDDFNRFVSDQRLEVEKTHASLRDYVNHQTKEQGDVLSKQFREVTDDTRRAMINSMDDVKKLAARTSEELKRIKGAVDDNTQRLSEQHQYLHNRVQQILDEEVKRFDRLAEDSRLRLAQQIESEVTRAVTSTEGSLIRAYHTMKEQQEREGRLVKEELEGLRGSLAAVAAPSTTMAAFEARVDSLRKDITQLHVNFSRFSDFESKVTSTLNFELRKANEGIRGDILRDVGTQLQRFDRALTDLSAEQQSQYSALTHQVMAVKEQTNASINTINASVHANAQGLQQQLQLQQHRQQQQQPYGGGLNASNIGMGATNGGGGYSRAASMMNGGGGGGFRLPPPPSSTAAASRSGTPAAGGGGGVTPTPSYPYPNAVTSSAAYSARGGGGAANFSPDRSQLKDLFALNATSNGGDAVAVTSSGSVGGAAAAVSAAGGFLGHTPSGLNTTVGIGADGSSLVYGGGMGGGATNTTASSHNVSVNMMAAGGGGAHVDPTGGSVGISGLSGDMPSPSAVAVTASTLGRSTAIVAPSQDPLAGVFE